MDFAANKTLVEIFREGAFGGTYFRDIYSRINEKCYRKSWKEFDQLKNIDHKFYCSDYYDPVSNEEHREDIGKIKVGLIKQILMVGFSRILGIGQVQGQKMMKEKSIDGKEL